VLARGIKTPDFCGWISTKIVAQPQSCCSPREQRLSRSNRAPRVVINAATVATLRETANLLALCYQNLAGEQGPRGCVQRRQSGRCEARRG